MGAFATTNEPVAQSGEISQSRLILLEMLNQLRGEADTSTIVAIAKRDPAVVLKLLEMANSPLSGLSRQVASLEEAIQLLGRDLLYRWLALALFRTNAQGFRDETLMSIALSRAAFLEQFAPENDRKQAGELFLVGLFSLVENLFQHPLEKILARLQLPDAVSAVLARSEGPYAGYLRLSLAMERLKLEQILPLCGKLNVTPATVFERYRQAMAWATETATN